jgi:integrase/recombinase XerC
MSDTAKLIQPAVVQRDGHGNWHHPDLPTFHGTDEAPEGAPTWKEWLEGQRLEQSISRLEDEEDTHPVYISYFEQDDTDPNFSAWEPAPPDGEGWFLLAISDTEEGPYAWFVRRKESRNV